MQRLYDRDGVTVAVVETFRLYGRVVNGKVVKRYGGGGGQILRTIINGLSVQHKQQHI